jgi:uncharacterized protein (TIGR04255 family)
MPTLLRNPPLVEAVFELRFNPNLDAAGDILIGLLYASLNAQYSRVEPLPMANVPREIRSRDPNLRYQASHRLWGDGKSVHVGDYVVGTSTTAYPGWDKFREQVEQVVQAVHSTKIVKDVERFSFRYVNILQADPSASQFDLLNCRIEVAGTVPLERGFMLRIEQDDGPYTSIIQLYPNASIESPEVNVSGLLVDIDTRREADGFFMNLSTMLNEAHEVLKRNFHNVLSDRILKVLPT